MRHRIVYTRHDGGVSVNCPAPRAIRELQTGAWGGKPRGFADREIEFSIRDGRNPEGVRRFAMAMCKGGVTEREAWAIIRDRDCLHKGTLHELQDLADLPDRWFRDAWRRSSNGGPVGVSLELARPIHWDRLQDAIDRENKRRERLLNPIAPLDAAENYRSAVRHARDDDELKRIWPASLAQVA